MKTVKIADLKARLSEHLRAVRNGRALTVMDRETPIARIVPYEPLGGRLIIRKALGRRFLQRVPLPPPLKCSVDVVALLLKERHVDR